MGVANSDLRTLSNTGTTERAFALWSNVLEYLRVRVGKEGFDTWLAPTRGAGLEGGALVVEVPNSFSADWIGQHYSGDIQAALTQVAGETVAVSFRPEDVSDSTRPHDGLRLERSARRAPVARMASGYRLQNRYTFERFIVGESNRFACAAAHNVAQSPGSNYNPLFIYGGVGLGKTHLVQALGNLALANRPGLKVYYTAAEALFIELIQAIEKNTRIEFKNKYRELDLLLLDDIHYLIGKERLQEEVFYIFNSLHDTGSQIVFTSDRPPKDIPTLESRLASRLGSGLVVDIQPPELETRIAILKQKAACERIELPDDVAYYIAARVKTSVRELEGSLIRLLALGSLAGRPLSVDLAAEALKDIVKPEQPLDHNLIISACADSFGISVADITGNCRTKQLALARQVAMYLLRHSLHISLNEIGICLGGKDHTTVMHAVNKIEQLRTKDPALESRLDQLAGRISRGQTR
jgi:chromosomal replication initiator protein